MKTHLEDHEFAAAVEGLELEGESAEHLAACISCRQQVAALQTAICDRRLGMESEVSDWDRQREEILAQLPSLPATGSPSQRRWLRPLLAAAATLLVAVGVNSLWDPPGGTEPTLGTEIEIEEILAEVDAVLADDSLPGFEFIDPGVDDPESLFENGAS